jgi:hypothetical protein
MTNESARDYEKGLTYIVTSLIPKPQVAELVQPTQGVLCDPAMSFQSTAVFPVPA